MQELKQKILNALNACKKAGLLKMETPPELQLEAPNNPEHGDFATNVAMMMAKSEGRPPRKIAEDIVAHIGVPDDFLLAASVAGPGFINFKIDGAYFIKKLEDVHKAGEKFGHIKYGKGKRVQVEFVSANPTGPLHVGHGRGAVYGDTLARLLAVAGFKVEKEYYLNDAGVQMKTLGLSVWLRMKELQGEKIEFPENCYQGTYIKEIAKELLNPPSPPFTKGGTSVHPPFTKGGTSVHPPFTKGGTSVHPPFEKGGKGGISEEETIAFCGQYAGKKIHDVIVRDLADCGVTHDVFFNETDLHKNGRVEKTVEFLREKGEAFDNEGAIWFRSTAYGDEKDRVLKKSDGYFTYFAADIAYHKDKFDRGFDRVIDVWGADHAGHVPRMKAAIQALGHDPAKFDAVLIQLVNLLRGGQMVSMSTRSAQYETLRTLLDEVGRDACRYFFLMRSHDAQLDFDIELAKSQTMDNPVYYIQYAHARISSVFAKAAASGLDCVAQVFRPASIGRTKVLRYMTTILNLPEEADIARFIADYPAVIEEAAIKLEPHRIAYYLLELARKFQSYYSKGNKEPAYRFLSDDKERTLAKCYLLKNIQIVLKNGLDVLGISAPDRMDNV